jgi:hypothetical protein
MPRKPAQKPWLAEGVSRSTWYRRRAKARDAHSLASIKRACVASLLTGSCAHDANTSPGDDLLRRAERFVAQLQTELAEAARCHAIEAGIIDTMPCSIFLTQ